MADHHAYIDSINKAMKPGSGVFGSDQRHPSARDWSPSAFQVVAAGLAGGMVAASKDFPTAKQAVDFYEEVLAELRSRAQAKDAVAKE